MMASEEVEATYALFPQYLLTMPMCLRDKGRRKEWYGTVVDVEYINRFLFYFQSSLVRSSNFPSPKYMPLHSDCVVLLGAAVC